MLSFHDIEDFQEIDATLIEQGKRAAAPKDGSDAERRNADALKDRQREAADRQRQGS